VVLVTGLQSCKPAGTSLLDFNTQAVVCTDEGERLVREAYALSETADTSTTAKQAALAQLAQRIDSLNQILVPFEASPELGDFRTTTQALMDLYRQQATEVLPRQVLPLWSTVTGCRRYPNAAAALSGEEALAYTERCNRAQAAFDNYRTAFLSQNHDLVNRMVEAQKVFAQRNGIRLTTE
jgi:hypothetical protein